MAQKTALSILGLPGSVHIFTAKTPSEPSVEWITALGVGGWPGSVHVFTAKQPEAGTSRPIGHITALAAYGGPGGVHSFVAKTFTPEFTPGTPGASYMDQFGWNKYRVLHYGGRAKPS